MKFYLYDFDGTIYDGDSSVDFFIYNLKNNKKIMKMLPKILYKTIKYKLKLIGDTDLKEYIFSYLKYVPDIDSEVTEFWKNNENKIKQFYLEKDHSKDLITSASPEFFLKPICDKLKVFDLIGSDVDKKTGKFNKENNRGINKVKSFKEKYPKGIIMEMYSDSMNDKPLLDIAKKSYVIKKDKIYDYKTYKPSIIKRIWNKCFSIYHKNEEIWNYLIAGGLTTLVSIGSYALFAKCFNINYIISNILSWIVAVVFAYFVNRIFVFKSKDKNKLKEFLSFTGARLLTLLLDTGLMILLVQILHVNDMISKVLVQIIIIIANYLISKLIIFRKKEL